jgi:hypothetical protein
VALAEPDWWNRDADADREPSFCDRKSSGTVAAIGVPYSFLGYTMPLIVRDV